MSQIRMLLMIAILALTGCEQVAGPTETLIPATLIPSQIWEDTDVPTETLVSVVTHADPTLAPSPGATQTQQTLPEPTLTPAVTSTPPQSPSLPTESSAIQINAPGPMSMVVSPIRVRGYVVPGANNLVRIELFGEDERLLVRQVIRLYTTQIWAYLSVELAFDVHAAGEIGRLTLSTEDSHGRVNSLNSIHLILLSQGFAQITPPGDLDERCVLITPVENANISGGSLEVSGHFRPFNDQPLVVELLNRNGTPVGSRQVVVSPTPDDGYVPFSTEIPYQVQAATWVRLVVRQADQRIGGTMYLYSRDVFLIP